MEKIGSQTRENIEEDDVYTVIEGPEEDDSIILFNKVGEKYERWTKNDDFAGYVLVIDGVGYEFVRTL